MYIAVINGWTEVMAFSENEETAIKLAMEKKQSFAEDDLEVWTWENVQDYYGAYTEKITEGTVLTD